MTSSSLLPWAIALFSVGMLLPDRGFVGAEGTGGSINLLLLGALLANFALQLYRRPSPSSTAISEIHFRAFTDNLPAKAWIDSGEGRILYQNSSYQRSSMVGNVTGKLLFEVYPAQCAQQFYDNIQTVLQTQQVIEVIEQMQHSDGSIACYLVYKFPITGSRGKRLVGGIGINITERVQAEAALETLARKEQMLNRVIQMIRNSIEIMPIFDGVAREVAQLLQADQVDIAQYLPDQKLWRRIANHRENLDLPLTLGLEIPDEDNPIAVRLKQHEIVCINDTCTLQDAINRPLAQKYPGAWLLAPLPVGTSVWGCLTLQRSSPAQPWQAWEVDFIRTVSEQLAIGLQQAQFYEQMQQLNAVLEVQVEERTAQLQQAFVLEAALKRITDKVRDSLDESQILQTAVQELGRLLEASSCDTGIYDLERQTSTIAYEYTMNESFAAQGVVMQMADYPHLYPQLLRGEYLHYCSLDVTSIRSTRDFVALLACPIVDDQGVLGDLWLSHQHDAAFTELEIRLVQQVANQCAIALRQSRLYQAVQAQVYELERLNQLKDDFLSTVSHELRTPMYSIKLAIEMLEHCLHEPSSAQRYVQVLRDECDRETELINDLLDLSRLEAKTEPLLLSTLPLRSWLLHIAEAFADRTCQQQQTLHFDLPADLPSITTDFSYLDRILTELLHNACKYTPAEEAIVLFARSSEATVQIGVKNSGVEIAPTEQVRIFDKFYRIPNHDPWKYSGTGLGLALVKRRAEQIHGDCTVSSELGWTTFTITLSRT